MSGSDFLASQPTAPRKHGAYMARQKRAAIVDIELIFAIADALIERGSSHSNQAIHQITNPSKRGALLSQELGAVTGERKESQWRSDSLVHPSSVSL